MHYCLLYPKVTIIILSIVPGAPPQNLTAESVAIGTIQLSWNPPRSDRQYGIITGYSITYQINGSSESPMNVNTSNVTSFEIMGLKSNTNYSVTIAAINGAGTSMNVTAVVVMTIPNRECILITMYCVHVCMYVCTYVCTYTHTPRVHIL